jgi:glycosyltransferase involved in cell wall biosynthesis
LTDYVLDLPIDSERMLGSAIPALPNDLRMPLVSVIVTAYNSERYVRQTLESVAEQSYARFECIIVEDCSTDGTLSVIEDFLKEQHDPRFRLLRHEKNRGQMVAEITGFRACGGAFVVFLDSDDLLFPDSLEAHLAVHLGCEPVAAMTCFDAAMIDGNDVLLSAHHREIRERRWSFFRPEATEKTIYVLGHQVNCRIIPPAPANRLLLREQYFWTTQSFMMFRYHFLSLIVPDETDLFRICADYYLACMTHAFNTTILVGRCGGAYRLHGSNGFAQAELISAEQESADPTRFRWQRQHGAELAAVIIEKRFEKFGSTFGDFRVARALLSLPGRVRPSVYRLLRTRLSFFQTALHLIVAFVSARITRARISWGTCKRVFWAGY